MYACVAFKQNECMLTARVPRPDKLHQFPAIAKVVEFRNGDIYSGSQ